MSSATSESEFNGTEASLVSSTVEFNSSSVEETSKDDKVKPIVEEIIAREKENRKSVKDLQQILKRNEKKRLELTITLNQKLEKAKKVERQCQTVVKELKKIESTIPKDFLTDSQNCLKTLNDCFQRIKEVLSDLTKDIQDKERFLANSAKLISEEEEDDMVGEKREELNHVNSLLNGLKQVKGTFLKSCTEILKPEKNAERFSSIQNVVDSVEVRMQEYSRAEEEKEKMTSKFAELNERKTKFDEIIQKRKTDRKQFIIMEKQVRKEFEEIARQCNNVEILPEVVSDQIAAHLNELYKWGSRNRNELEKKSKEMKKRWEQIKREHESNSSRRKLIMLSINDDVRYAEENLAKLIAENKKLTELVAKSQDELGAEKVKTREMFEEIKSVVENLQMKDATWGSANAQLEKEVDDFEEANRENRRQLDIFQRKREKLEDDLRRIEREIRDQERQRMKSATSLANARIILQERIEKFKAEKETLQKNIQSASERSQNDFSKQKLLMEAQKRRIAKLEKTKSEKQDQLKSFDNDLNNLRRRNGEMVKQCKMINEEINRQRRNIENFKRRFERENSNLNDLLNEIKQEQEKNATKRRQPIMIPRPSMSPMFNFEQNSRFRSNDVGPSNKDEEMRIQTKNGFNQEDRQMVNSNPTRNERHNDPVVIDFFIPRSPESTDRLSLPQVVSTSTPVAASKKTVNVGSLTKKAPTKQNEEELEVVPVSLDEAEPNN